MPTTVPAAQVYQYAEPEQGCTFILPARPPRPALGQDWHDAKFIPRTPLDNVSVAAILDGAWADFTGGPQ